MLKGSKKFMAPLGPKIPSITYILTFYGIFMMKLAQNFIFQRNKRQIFVKRRNRRQNFGRFAPKTLPPTPNLWRRGGAETLDLAVLGGGGCPPSHSASDGVKNGKNFFFITNLKSLVLIVDELFWYLNASTKNFWVIKLGFEAVWECFDVWKQFF